MCVATGLPFAWTVETASAAETNFALGLIDSVKARGFGVRNAIADSGAIEREFGRLKHEWAMLPLRVRGLDRVRLHADLTILASSAARWHERELRPLLLRRAGTEQASRRVR